MKRNGRGVSAAQRGRTALAGATKTDNKANVATGQGMSINEKGRKPDVKNSAVQNRGGKNLVPAAARRCGDEAEVADARGGGPCFAADAE